MFDYSTFAFEDCIGKYCNVEFKYADSPERKMSYDGVIERVVRGEDEEDHIVFNVRYGGRTPITLSTIVNVQELPSE